MINQLVLFAEYNQLMNQRQYDAAAKLSKADLCNDKGAFFKSVLGNLNHILVGDITWLKRFSAYSSSRETFSYLGELERPASLDAILYMDFPELRKVREKIDQIIIEWLVQLPDEELAVCISYTDMEGNEFSQPFPSLVNHLFLHQVHHRGQVSTLLSQCGVDFGETDLIEIITECGT